MTGCLSSSAEPARSTPEANTIAPAAANSAAPAPQATVEAQKNQPAAQAGAEAAKTPTATQAAGDVAKTLPSQHSASLTTAANQMPPPPPAQGEVALLKLEIMSLKEKVATLQRKFDVILKGQRSGLYDDAATVATAAFQKAAAAQKNPIPPLTSDGPVDRFESDDTAALRERSLTPEKPQQLVDKANLLLEQREFGRVAQLLENFQQRFPNNGLSAIAELTLAEAYVELKSPQQALTHVRTFYLQHPNDVQLVRAKWLEARAQELLDAPQKAAALFREVIALDPQSQLALKSRAALEKIGGGGTQ
jgi:tetratricopeptide (TPR) repeat protein